MTRRHALFHNGRSPFGPRRRRGFTLLETLLALAISSVFLAAAYTSFIQMLRAHSRAQARLEALRNARSALMTIADEVKSISTFNSTFLIGQNINQGFGDGINNDDDGATDEEVVNGRDDDGDWIAAQDDRHIVIPGSTGVVAERFMYTAVPPYPFLYGNSLDDLGDAHVDEDVQFGADVMTFRVAPTSTSSNVLFRTITYSIATFDSQPRVLVRTARTEFTAASGLQPVQTISPLAFDCMGFDALYWNPNGMVQPNSGVSRTLRPYYVEGWNSVLASTFQPPQLPLPASIFIMITEYADGAPIENYVNGRPIQTLRMPTMINIEQIIDSPVYPRASI